MCLSPIQIINPSKYVSLRYRDRFLLSIPCGHCAECQQTNSNQWYMRTYYECQDIQQSGGYIYWDTLSYRSTPMMSDIFPWLPDVSCFSREHIRLFIENLRVSVKRNYNETFRYFLSSEYGSDDHYYDDKGRLRHATMRPHYHVMFFLPSTISPLEFSALVAEKWTHGRTDGSPYKSMSYVLEHNVINSSSLPLHYLRACRYVTKYVQKSCQFSEMIDTRLKSAMWQCAEHIAPESPLDWLDSDNARHVKSVIKRQLVQFHSQSKGYGASFLCEFDISQYMRDGCLFVSSVKSLKMAVAMPTYYKRKLFYNLLVVDGSPTWQLNELGIEVKRMMQDKLVSRLSERFHSLSLTYNLGYNDMICKELSDYVYNYQGRIDSNNDPSLSIRERIESVDFFNYSTVTDKESLVKRGLYPRYLGNANEGYLVDSMPSDYTTFKTFISSFVINDPEKEAQLNKIYYHLNQLNDSQQVAYSEKQRLEQTYKLVRSWQLHHHSPFVATALS